MTLVARESEGRALTTLLDAARVGMSGALVVYGDAGIGKSAILDLAADLATDFQVYRCSGVESEVEISFAALHQLCGSMEHQLARLPDPQAAAISVALGLRSGTTPDQFLVGIAVLNLLATLAEERPLLWIVDDAQWLDRASAEVLAFVARRLGAESVVLLFAVRSTVGSPKLEGLPRVVLSGLSDADSRTLLAATLPVRLDAQVRDRILAEANGNPLALLEFPRSVSPAEFAGGFRVPEDASVAARIEQLFRDRLSQQPDATQRLILLAAAEPLGDPHLLWRAAALLGLGNDAARAAESTDLLRIGGRVIFRHPLVRSAVYWSATDDSRRSVHGALAEATDAASDPDRRAWHRAAASFEPDEEIAEELERSAKRAQARGGVAAAAAFLQRASELTPDRARRATRALTAAHAQQLAGNSDAARELAGIAELGPLDPLDLAKLELLRARAALYLTFDRTAPQLFVDAAARLAALDPALSREAYLEAFEAATYAGRLGDEGGLRRAAEAAAAAPAVIGKPRAVDLLLDGLATRFAGGGASAFPTLQKALALFRVEPDDQWLWTAMRTTTDVWDFETWDELTRRQVNAARENGALTMLPIALNNRAGVQIFAGRFEAAQGLIDEADNVTNAIGAARVPYAPAFLAAWRGREQPTSALVTSILRDVEERGEGFAVTFTNWAYAVQLNGLCRYDLALEASMTASEPDEPGWAVCALLEVIEAAVRTDNLDIATRAFQRFAIIARASNTEWALGLEARSHALVAGGSAAAEALYEEAIERLSQTQVAVDLARAHLLFGEWLRRQRRRAEARRQLRLASDLFSSMGAEAFAERARVELLATGERVRRRSDEVRFQLTPQQTQIARLASEGHSNQEIASRLFISSRTVEYHLRNVFLALNITSRRELNGALI